MHIGVRVLLKWCWICGVRCKGELANVWVSTGWAKFMEWKYPVEVVVTSKKTFRTAGAVEAAATL